MKVKISRSFDAEKRLFCAGIQLEPNAEETSFFDEEAWKQEFCVKPNTSKKEVENELSDALERLKASFGHWKARQEEINSWRKEEEIEI